MARLTFPLAVEVISHQVNEIQVTVEENGVKITLLRTHFDKVWSDGRVNLFKITIGKEQKESAAFSVFSIINNKTLWSYDNRLHMVELFTF